MELQSVLGESRRQGDYRVVKVRSGAGLADIAARWCGDRAELPVVEALNETLVGQRLGPDQEVLVPWVEPTVLLAAHAQREAQRAAIEKAAGELYALRRGDSLWKIAAARVPTNRIPAWLEEFKKLNPEIGDLGTLIEGQKVRLP
jgi:hypothetical protein